MFLRKVKASITGLRIPCVEMVSPSFIFPITLGPLIEKPCIYLHTELEHLSLVIYYINRNLPYPVQRLLIKHFVACKQIKGLKGFLINTLLACVTITVLIMFSAEL